METEREEYIETLSLTALAFDLGKRAEYLKQVCGGDPTLQAEIESRITQYESANRTRGVVAENGETLPLIADGTVELLTEERQSLFIEQHLGNYRLIRQIGKGGMGSVYLAERDDEQFKMRVAIKLINRGMATEVVLRRFLSERQILANLDHPFIGRLIDGGTTPDGLPYFVMEYIEGTPVTKYCDEKQLLITERLKLFRKICEAVHYAHQNLVIHRDIKPSNILVTGDGTPKLVDFGIAKLLHREAADSADATVAGARLMTPQYASPEQVKGEPITTVSDVYSLGVLLYELLTGHRPYTFKKRTMDEVMRIVCEENPEKPSLAITRTEEMMRLEGETKITVTPETISRERRTPPDKMRRLLAGDLDNITLKAMRKEPQRRYSSVAEFSNDLNRYLEGLPITARKDTLAYRAQKFIRRNKLGVAAAGLLVITLIAGMIATLWQAQIARRERARAEKRFQDVRTLANSFMFEIHEAIQDLPGATPARELLVSKALLYLDSLAQESSNDASLQGELATAYDKVGAIQGDPFSANLGNPTGAPASYRKALAIRQAISAANPDNAEMLSELAGSYSLVGDMLDFNQDLPGVIETKQKALAIYEKLSQKNPADLETRMNIARTRSAISKAMAQKGDLEGAIEEVRQALTIAEEVVTSAPENAGYRRSLATTYQQMSLCLTVKGDQSGGMEISKKALALFEELAKKDPNNAKAQRELAYAYNKIGDLFWDSKALDDALGYYRKGLKIAEELAAVDPNNVQAQRDLAKSYGNVGYTLAQVGTANEGVETYKKSIQIMESLYEANPGSVSGLRDLAISYEYFGDVYTFSGEQKSATTAARAEALAQAKANYKRSRKMYLDIRARGGDEAC